MLRVLVIPHGRQRYPTVGDWFFDRSSLEVRVSELGDWRMEACVAVHEVVEALCCRGAKVTQKAVDEFDRAFEASRPVGSEAEPGDSSRAPYYAQHQVATACERMVALMLGVKWDEYEKRCNEVYLKKAA